MTISEVLNQAERGALEHCLECPRSPNNNQSVSFGASCIIHGLNWKKKNGANSFGTSCIIHRLNWKKKNRANSMLIAQDPGNAEPETTSVLCARNYDTTAMQQIKLWGATVARDYHNPEKDGYMKKHYWTNAIMHGSHDNNTMEQARKCCAEVLASQIQALQPKVIVASGKKAFESLRQIGILKGRWDAIKKEFDKGACQRAVHNWRNISEFTVFCTYHTAARAVNNRGAARYTIETEQYIEEKIKNLDPVNLKSVKEFLLEHNPEGGGRGMCYLLNHWLDIGKKIREEYEMHYKKKK